MAEIELVSLSSIRITLMPDIYADASPSEFECTVAIDTGVFSGTFGTIFFDEDLLNFKEALEALQIPGTAILGGNRCAEVTFEISNQIGGSENSLAITVSATPVGDDPWPKLSFLEFDVAPGFIQSTIEKINQFLAPTRQAN